MKQKFSEFLKVIGIYKPIRFIFNRIARFNKQTSIKFDDLSFYFWTPTFYLNDYVLNFAGEKDLIIQILTELNEKDIFWDIGANIGFHSIIVGAKCKSKNVSVKSFEPEDKTFKLLKKNIELNKCENITAYQIAAGENNYQRVLYPSDSPNFGAHSFIQCTDYRVKKRGKKVEVFSVDCLIREKNIPCPNVLKIDVEGAEILILKGMEETLLNPELRTIFLELHVNLLPKFNSSMSEVIKIIEGNGFVQKQKNDRADQMQFVFKRS